MSEAHEGCLRAVRDALVNFGKYGTKFATPQSLAKGVAAELDGLLSRSDPSPAESGMPTRAILDEAIARYDLWLGSGSYNPQGRERLIYEACLYALRQTRKVNAGELVVHEKGRNCANVEYWETMSNVAERDAAIQRAEKAESENQSLREKVRKKGESNARVVAENQALMQQIVTLNASVLRLAATDPARKEGSGP